MKDTKIEDNTMKKSSIKLVTIVFMIYSYVASGAFGIEDMVGQSGPGMTLLLLILIPIVWGLPYGLASAEQGSAWPNTGGAIDWAEKTFGRYGGFHSGWLTSIGLMCDLSIFLVWVTEYSEFFLGELSIFQKFLILAFFVSIFIYINIKGIELLSLSAATVSVIILIPFIILTILGFINFQHNPVVPFIAEGNTIGGSLSTGLLIGIWMFSGYDGVGCVAGEIKNAGKLIPKALLISMPLIVIMYLLPTIAGLGAIGQWSQWTTEGLGYNFVEIGAQLGGPLLGTMLYIALIIATIPLYLDYLAYVSRTLYFLSTRNLMIKSFSKLHPKHHTPYIAIIVSGLISLLLSLFLPFSILVITATVIYVAFYVILFMGTYLKRKKYPQIESSYKIPLGDKGVFLFMLMPTLIVIWAVLQESIGYILLGIVLNITTPIFYRIFQKIYGNSNNNTKEDSYDI